MNAICWNLLKKQRKMWSNKTPTQSSKLKPKSIKIPWANQTQTQINENFHEQTQNTHPVKYNQNPNRLRRWQPNKPTHCCSPPTRSGPINHIKIIGIIMRSHWQRNELIHRHHKGSKSIVFEIWYSCSPCEMNIKLVESGLASKSVSTLVAS